MTCKVRFCQRKKDIFFVMSGAWKIIKLQYPDSESTHSIFYQKHSALELEAYNFPLTDNTDQIIKIFEETFSLYGKLDSVTIDGSQAIIKFQNEKSLDRALLEKFKHHDAELPPAYSGDFGVEYFKKKYMQQRPEVADLEKSAYEQIKAIDKRDNEARANAGTKHIARHTEAETQAILEKYQKTIQKMQSTDFYEFQQKNKPNLYTALLGEEVKQPRHLKKQPKKKVERPVKGKPVQQQQK